MATEVRLREMSITDYDEVFALWLSTEGIALNAADSRENVEMFLDRNKGLCFVAVGGDGEILGTLLSGHDGRRGYFHHLAVKTDYRNMGIGKRLVEECLINLKAAGILKCHLFALNNNPKGISFWQKIGFTLRDTVCILSKDIQ